MAQPNGITSVQYGNAVVDRMPPHSIEAEEAVIGSLLIDPEALERVQRILLPPDFFITRNAWMYEACLALRERNEPIDFVTIVKELGARGTLDEMGGPAEIARMMNATPTAIHAE